MVYTLYTHLWSVFFVSVCVVCVGVGVWVWVTVMIYIRMQSFIICISLFRAGCIIDHLTHSRGSACKVKDANLWCKSTRKAGNMVQQSISREDATATYLPTCINYNAGHNEFVLSPL